jgi:threonine dehydrogenase-like Zn-dependent dehydrogenase
VLGIAGRDGAFAEWTKLPAENLHVVPDELSDDQAVFVEPVAAACEILTQVAIGRNDRIAVIGAGRLGTLVAQVLRPHAGELRLFSRTLAQATRCQAMALTLEAIDAAPSATFDLVVEASGSSAGFEHAMRIARPRGTIVLKSTYAGNSGPNPTLAVIHEMTIIGSRCGPFDKAIDALKTGCVKIEPLIAARYSLNDAVAAMAHAATPGIGKVLIEMT